MEDGNYYNGQWLNDNMEGKGKIYNKNGLVIYDGDFLNDNYDGYGEYIYENVFHYIGQFVKDTIKGK